MRHRKRSRRLVGKWEHRRALIRNLLNSLFVHERITTTLAKAKELRRAADKMITLAKRGDLHARRRALAVLQNKELVRKLFAEAKERFGDRQGGYTRIVRIGPRRGDAAMMAIVELVAEKLEHKRSRRKIEADRAALAMAPKKEEPKVEEPKPEVETEEARAEAQVEEAKPEVQEVEAKVEETEAQEATAETEEAKAETEEGQVEAGAEEAKAEAGEASQTEEKTKITEESPSEAKPTEEK